MAKKSVVQTQSALLPGIPDQKIVTRLKRQVDLNSWRKAVDPLVILNLGGGRQSSVLYLLALQGIAAQRPHFATFADTGSEPAWVYAQIKQLEEINETYPESERISILSLRNPDKRTTLSGEAMLSAHVNQIGWQHLSEAEIAETQSAYGRDVFRWIGPPAYTDGGAPLKRTCTQSYKIDVQESWMRAYMAEHPEYKTVVNWRGHSMNEVQRAHNDDRQKWFTRFPLLEEHLSDDDLAAFAIEKYGLVFRWSACWCCPFILRNPARVRDLVLHDPHSFLNAAYLDNALRTAIPRTTSAYCWLAGPGVSSRRWPP